MALSLLYCDGFDTLDSLSLEWDNNGGGSSSINLTGTLSRTGLGCLVINASPFGPNKIVPVGTNFIVGAAYNPNGSTPSGAIGNLIWLLQSLSNTQVVRLVYNPNLSISILTGNDPFPTTLGTSAPSVVQANQYNYITMKVFISTGGSGTCVVRVNGNVVLNLTGLTFAVANADTVQLNQFGGLSISYWDDFMIWSWSSGADDITDVPNIYSFTPSADSTPLQWTPSTGTAHFPLVNSVPENETTYNSSGVIGQTDQYAHTLATNQNKPSFPQTIKILGCQHTMLMQLDNGARSVASDFGGTAAAGVALTSVWKAYPFPYAINPATAAPWVQSDLTTPMGPTVTA